MRRSARLSAVAVVAVGWLLLARAAGAQIEPPTSTTTTAPTTSTSTTTSSTVAPTTSSSLVILPTTTTPVEQTTTTSEATTTTARPVTTAPGPTVPRSTTSLNLSPSAPVDLPTTTSLVPVKSGGSSDHTGELVFAVIAALLLIAIVLSAFTVRFWFATRPGRPARTTRPAVTRR